MLNRDPLGDETRADLDATVAAVYVALRDGVSFDRALSAIEADRLAERSRAESGSEAGGEATGSR